MTGNVTVITRDSGRIGTASKEFMTTPRGLTLNQVLVDRRATVNGTRNPSVPSVSQTAECKYPGCARDAYRVGWCCAHYERQRRGKDMDAPHRRHLSPEERFWEKVDKTGDCWVWTAKGNKKGYGRFYLDGGPRLAHRVAYEFANGQIPDGLDLDHTCHVHACVNQAHLRPVTNAQNHQNHQGANSNSVSGVRGVSWGKARGKWRATVRLDRKHHDLGHFATVAEAEAVVTEWRRIHMPYSVMDQTS